MENLDEILDDLNDCGRLNDWALDFVDGMLKRREANPDLWDTRLSEKQRAKLHELWDKYCG